MSNISLKYFTELNLLPLYNWMKCQQGEIEYVRRDGIADEGKDLEIWENLQDEYIKSFGHSKNYERLLQVIKEKALLEIDFVKTREKFKLTEIKIREERLRQMIETNGSGMSIEESLIPLSKYMGFRLNIREIMTKEYYSILKRYGEENKQIGHSGK